MSKCQNCAHWGVQTDLRETSKWKFCLQLPPALAHADFSCNDYERRKKPAPESQPFVLISQQSEEKYHEVYGGKRSFS
jgi:hypothetical protein